MTAGTVRTIISWYRRGVVGGRAEPTPRASLQEPEAKGGDTQRRRPHRQSYPGVPQDHYCEDAFTEKE